MHGVGQPSTKIIALEICKRNVSLVGWRVVSGGARLWRALAGCLLALGAGGSKRLCSYADAAACGGLFATAARPVRRLGRRAAAKSSAALRRSVTAAALGGSAVCYVCYRRCWRRHDVVSADSAHNVFRDPAPLGPWTVSFLVSWF